VIGHGIWGKSLEAAYSSPLPDVTTLTVQFLTPLRVKYQNRLKADLPFHILIRTALRRIATLCQAYGTGEPALDYRRLVREAEGGNDGDERLGLV